MERKPPAFALFTLFIISLASFNPNAAALPPTFLPGVSLGTVEHPDLNEIIGFGVSRDNPGVLWVCNDSPDDGLPENRLFAMSTQGRHLGMYYLPGADNYDGADLAMGPGPDPNIDYIYFGDFGDDYQVRDYVTLYRIPEPTVSVTQDPVTQDITGVETIKLVFPGGTKHDSHTMILDPATHDLYILTREYWFSAMPQLYHASASQLIGGTTVSMEQINVNLSNVFTTAKNGQPTSATMTPNGGEIIIRTPGSAYWWARPQGTNIENVITTTPTSLPPILGNPSYFGQAIAFDVLGKGYYTVTEGINQPIYYYDREVTNTLVVTPDSRNVALQAGSTTFDVSNPTGLGMTWTAEVLPGADWAAITSGTTGVDNGTITVEFDENTNPTSRTATVRVTAGTSTVDVTVVQARLIPGDANKDGSCNLPDLSALAGHYGQTVTGDKWAQGDFNNDGFVNLQDLSILAAHYGQGSGGR